VWGNPSITFIFVADSVCVWGEEGGVLDLQRSSEISGEFVVIHHLLMLLSKRDEEILRKFHIENTLVLDRMEVEEGGRLKLGFNNIPRLGADKRQMIGSLHVVSC
jgi:hypothetical protein